MSLLIEINGITKLSELEIDVDKDWQAKGIVNLKQLAALMSKGDIIVRGDNILVRLAPGPDGYVLTSTGPGKMPTWAPAGGALKYYFPVQIRSSLGVDKAAVSRIIDKSALLGSSHVQAYLDDVAENVKRLTSSIASARSVDALAGPHQNFSTNARTKCALSILCDGFVEETALGVQTDHTAAARDGNASDLNLCPMSDSLNDKVYVGSFYKFWEAQIHQGVQGVGNWSNMAYYWNGSWSPVVGEIDGSSSFQGGSGLRFIIHTPQNDWALTTVMGMNLYWMMVRTDYFNNRTTKPLGSQVWVAVN